MATQSSEIKESVKQKYSKIARDAGGCCEGGGEVFNMMNESYAQLAGYTPDADLSLGCGIPVKTAELKPGQHVLDLGSGAGNDIFVARSVVGASGQLTGLDFSEDMLAKARRNQQKIGYENIRFVQGDIEAMPLEAHQFDVVLSNCVLNLVPDKKAAFAEIFRVLRPGGHFTISDIVLEGQLSDWMLKSAELYAGCVSGAIQKTAYLDIVKAAGFADISIESEREIHIPDDWIARQFGPVIRVDNARILSITLKARKPE